MTYLKTQDYAEAESDCNQSLLINSRHSKSLYRRGLARKKMQKFKEALRVKIIIK
jgi:hypothetical protein